MGKNAFNEQIVAPRCSLPLCWKVTLCCCLCLLQMFLTVYLSNNEQHFTEVPVTPETTCRDVVELCKEPGESECHLAEVWCGSGRSGWQLVNYWASSAPQKAAHGDLTGVILSQRVSALPFHWFLHQTGCLIRHLQEGPHMQNWIKSKRELKHADVLVSVQSFCDSDESEGGERGFLFLFLPTMGFQQPLWGLWSTKYWQFYD